MLVSWRVFVFLLSLEGSILLVYCVSHNHGSGKLIYLKLLLEGPIFHFHDSAKKGTDHSRADFFLP